MEELENIADSMNQEAEVFTPLSEDDKEFIQKYNEEKSNRKGDPTILTANIIRYRGRCGFGNAGTIAYLLNTDTSNRYRVTVRMNYRQGTDYGSQDSVHIMAAGSRKDLNCTLGDFVPVSQRSFEVVGEERMNS